LSISALPLYVDWRIPRAIREIVAVRGKEGRKLNKYTVGKQPGVVVSALVTVGLHRPGGCIPARVTSWMGNYKPFQCVSNHLHQLSLPFSRNR